MSLTMGRTQARIDPVTDLRPADPPKTSLPPGAFLPVSGGHQVWWCEGGDPDGLPVLIVHGGPGGATRAEPAGWFAGQAVRWLAIDQRGCGRSLPTGRTDGNRLPDLIDDMERLRQQLGLERWALAGGSWGARVALGYAMSHPSRVTGLMLRSPFLATLPETRRYIAPWHAWLGSQGLARLGSLAATAVYSLYHDSTESFTLDTVGALESRFLNDDVTRAWGAFDDAQSAPGGVARQEAVWNESALPEASVGLRAAWAVHAHFALRGWGALDGVPVATQVPPLPPHAPVRMVWGADDATCDPAAARSLAQALISAGLAVHCEEVPGAGHRMGDPRLAPVLRDAARAWIVALQTAQQP